MKRWKTKYYVALAVFIISWILWPIAITHASGSHFTEDEFALQVIVLGGAVSMVAGSIANMWE
jgi:hypothetical protein